MGVKQKRARYKEEFRREILDAARELFSKEGYEKFSLRRLAERIEYSPTTIYLYFKDKDDLLFAICEEVAEQFLADLSRIGALQTDPLEALRQALLYLIEFGFGNPNQYKVFFFTNPTVYGTREEFMEKESMARSSYFAFRKIVQDCIETGRLREMDTEVLTQVLAVAAHGLIVMTLFNKSFPWADRQALAHTLVDGLLRGYRQ
ncbi:MAG: TetR/AcrR family transcriptional regulator [Thermodesulfovibrionales bacterium]